MRLAWRAALAAAALLAAPRRAAAQGPAGPPPVVHLVSFDLSDGSQSLLYPGGATENHCFFDSNGDGVIDYVNGQYGMFGYFEGWVTGRTAYVSWWEVTVYGMAGAVIPTSGAASLTYSFDPTSPSLNWGSGVAGSNVTGASWGAGATTLAGALGVWHSLNGRANATLAATPEISCLYSAPNQMGNVPTNSSAQYYWTPFWETSAPTSYRSNGGAGLRSFCSDAYAQPPDLVFTSSAQSNYGAVLGSYSKRNAAGVDCGPGAPQLVQCPTSNFDATEVGFYGAGAIPFAGAVSYGLVGTGQALTGPFAGRTNDGGSFSFLTIEAVNTSFVGAAVPNTSMLALKGFRCILAGTAPGGDAYRVSCAPEWSYGRGRGSITQCLQPYALTAFTNNLCAQSNAHGRPLGFPFPSQWAAAGFGAAGAAGTSAGGGYVPSAGGVGRRRGARRRRARQLLRAEADALRGEGEEEEEAAL